MVTIRDYIDKCDFVINTLVDEQKKVIILKKNEIIKLNIDNIDNHIGSDGKKLINSDDRYSGRYSKATELISKRENPLAPKIAGQPYNWVWDGNFIPNFQIKFTSKDKFEIFSTGTGAGKKYDFFQGYNNLFGLDTERNRIFNYEILPPDMMNYIKRYL